MAHKLGIPFTADLIALGTNAAISNALIEKAVAAGKTEAQIDAAMSTLWTNDWNMNGWIQPIKNGNDWVEMALIEMNARSIVLKTHIKIMKLYLSLNERNPKTDQWQWTMSLYIVFT